MIRLYLNSTKNEPYKLMKEVRSHDDKWFVGNINANHIEVVIDDTSSEILDVNPVLSLITSDNRTIYAIVPYKSDSIILSETNNDYYWIREGATWVSSKGEIQENLPNGHFVTRYFFSILNYKSNIIREGSANVQVIVEKTNYRQTAASIVINVRKGVYQTPEIFISSEEAVYDLKEELQAQSIRITDIDSKQNALTEEVRNDINSQNEEIANFKEEWLNQRIGLLSVGDYDSSTGIIEFVYDDEKIVDFEYDESTGILTIEY